MYNEGYSYREITDLTGVSHGTIAKYTDRNRKNGISKIARSIPLPPPEVPKAASLKPAEDTLILRSGDDKFALTLKADEVIIYRKEQVEGFSLKRSEFQQLVQLLTKADQIIAIITL